MIPDARDPPPADGIEDGKAVTVADQDLMGPGINTDIVGVLGQVDPSDPR
jgi:hypothetical protein